jgi:long-chain acyl-CoA synthetase
MYPGKHAAMRPGQAAFIMAQTGEAVSYAELEARSNRLAHLFRARGLRRLDHYAIFMENNARYIESCSAGARAGLYYTCVNSFLTPDELAYILDNSESKVLITSQANRDVAAAALRSFPKIELCLIADGKGDGGRFWNLDEATAAYPATPVADESLGAAMLYSSGTTGRPKGILRPLPMQPPSQQLPLYAFLDKLWHYRDGMIYLSPAPLYHSAPQAAVSLTIDRGGTVIVMETFDAERYLRLVQDYRVTHSQPCPHHVLAHAQAARGRTAQLRSVLTRDRGTCRGAVSRASKAANDRVVGADHSRVLRRHRSIGVQRLRQCAMAGAPGNGRQGAVWRASCSRRGHEALPDRDRGHAVVQDRDPVRIFQRSGEDR